MGSLTRSLTLFLFLGTVRDLRVLIDGKNFRKLHLLWFMAFLVASGLAASVYLAEAKQGDRWPGGGSRVGLVMGATAGLIILFECAIVLRKTSWFRARRWIGSAQGWMKAHIWLGLLTVPLVLFHSGFRWGGTFTTVLSVCFATVIVSGIVGLLLQNILPRLLLHFVEEETVYSQIDNVSAQFVSEASRIVSLTCGDGSAAELPDERQSIPAQKNKELQIVGSQRKVGAAQTRSPQGSIEFPPAASANALRFAFDNELQRFLATGESEGDSFSTRKRTEQYFDGLKKLVSNDAEHALDRLEGLCQRRREFNLQRKLHLILHGWLFVHLPISMALLILLLTHIYFALKIG